MLGKGTKHQETVKWSIRWKLMAIITVLVVGLVAVLSYVQISSQKKMMEDEMDNLVAIGQFWGGSFGFFGGMGLFFMGIGVLWFVDVYKKTKE